MAIRTLRRKVIIREYDFERVRDQAFAPLAMMGSLETLYDRAEFTPISQETLEKLKVIDILRSRKTKLSEVELDLKRPALLVAQLRDYLYSDKYYKWKVTVDDDGYICVQARKNTPKSRLGWAVFEKDIESRL
jgi:hypothetical protein